MDPYENLMIAVLAQAITDYIQAIKVGGLDFSEQLRRRSQGIVDGRTLGQGKEAFIFMSHKEKRELTAMSRGNVAKTWIFDHSSVSEEYVFGFEFICSYFGLEPQKFRKRITEKREEFWHGIYDKIREM